jgi:hypothetical protein
VAPAIDNIILLALTITKKMTLDRQTMKLGTKIPLDSKSEAKGTLCIWELSNRERNMQCG